METVLGKTAESTPNAAAIRTAEPTVDRDKWLRDLRTVVADVDRYLRATAEQAGEASAMARARLDATLSSIKAELAETQRDLAGKARAAARATDDYVHENPWRTIAVVAGAGLVAGLIIGRR